MLNYFIKKQLIDKNIVMYGDFLLKSGKKSNIYINLKNLISYPFLLSAICVGLKNKIKQPKDVVLCGVPYGGIPISTNISMITGIPQILLRKERKKYGTKKMIEGEHISKNVILIEDVITSGASVIESIEILEREGFNVVQILSVVYRGKQINSKIASIGFDYLFTLNDLQIITPTKNIEISNKYVLDLHERIHKKQSNIILAYDKPKDLLFVYLNNLHPYIIGLKIHSEILNLSKYEHEKLYSLCKSFNIFLWEDRKFNDIGNTLHKQLEYYEKKCDYVSVVPTSGPNSLNIPNNLGIFVLCEMSSKNNLFQHNITSSIISYVDKHRENVCGLICQSEELFSSINIPTIKPGINLDKTKDEKGQQYINPETLTYKPTLYVVGRGITESIDPVFEVQRYKEKLCFMKNHLKKNIYVYKNGV